MNPRALSLAATLALCLGATAAAQSDKQGTLYRSPGGSTLRLILDETNVGAEISVGELTFPPNSDSGDHAHGAIERFYVLSGVLEVGYVKPPDKIRHKTGPAGAKVVVMWVPGAEANKIASRWTKEP